MIKRLSTTYIENNNKTNEIQLSQIYNKYINVKYLLIVTDDYELTCCCIISNFNLKLIKLIEKYNILSIDMNETKLIKNEINFYNNDIEYNILYKQTIINNIITY